MPLTKTLATIAQCDLCPANIAHASSTTAPLADEALEAAGWLITAGVLCPRCRLLN